MSEITVASRATAVASSRSSAEERERNEVKMSSQRGGLGAVIRW